MNSQERMTVLCTLIALAAVCFCFFQMASCEMHSYDVLGKASNFMTMAP
jgi:hypothetical protein